VSSGSGTPASAKTFVLASTEKTLTPVGMATSSPSTSPVASVPSSIASVAISVSLRSASTPRSAYSRR
jgi:hypothetical protein